MPAASCERPGCGRRRVDDVAADPRDLDDEHSRLLRQVALRVDDLVVVASKGRWPANEVGVLAGYLRSDVLTHIAEEERVMFPAHPHAAAVVRLTRDHARLRAGIDVLARADRGEGSRSPAMLAATARGLLDQLERHFDAEENVMARVLR